MKKYGLLLFLILSISCFSENKKFQQLQKDTVKVKITEIDDQGKISLSMKEFETITDTEKEEKED